MPPSQFLKLFISYSVSFAVRGYLGLKGVFRDRGGSEAAERVPETVERVLKEPTGRAYGSNDL